jgi:hypothetical protein
VNETWWLNDQMTDSERVGHERIGNQPAVAAPPEGLGTHDREGLAAFRPFLEGR